LTSVSHIGTQTLCSNKHPEPWGMTVPLLLLLFISLLRPSFCRPHFQSKQNWTLFRFRTEKKPLTTLKTCYLQCWKYNLALWVHLLFRFIPQAVINWFTFPICIITTY